MPSITTFLPPETWLTARAGTEGWEASLRGPDLTEALEGCGEDLVELIERLGRDYCNRVGRQPPAAVRKGKRCGVMADLGNVIRCLMKYGTADEFNGGATSLDGWERACKKAEEIL